MPSTTMFPTPKMRVTIHRLLTVIFQVTRGKILSMTISRRNTKAIATAESANCPGKEKEDHTEEYEHLIPVGDLDFGKTSA